MIADTILRKFYEMTTGEMLMVFTFVLILIKTIQWLVKSVQELKSLPPGPWGFPIVGYLTFMGHEKHTELLNLAKKCGSIFSVRLGSQLTVVLSDYKLIRDCFRREEFTGRPDTPFMQTLQGFGIINSTGKLWKDQRKFLHEKLRYLGMTYMAKGKDQMEKRIMREVQECILTIQRESASGKAIDLAPAISVAVSNVICDIMMGVRFTIDDPKFRRFNFLIEEGMRLFGEITTVDYIPIVQYLPGNLSAKNKIERNREEMMQFYREVIDEHKRTFDRDNLRDLVDIYLDEIEKAKEEGRFQELFEGKDAETQIMQVIADLFSAGMETIKTTLLWSIVFMLHHPDKMQIVQQELDQVVGRHRLPSTEDLKNMPMVEATILEVMRRSSIVPLATTHSPTRDVEINGYKIPAGCHVVPLINAVHMDANLWDAPEQFNPNRFLDDECHVRRPEFFIPFGYGRRRCLGDTLAKMEVFLFFTTLLHCFDFILPDGKPLPSLKGNVGVTITPETYNVMVKLRPLIVTNNNNNNNNNNNGDNCNCPIRNVGSN